VRSFTVIAIQSLVGVLTISRVSLLWYHMQLFWKWSFVYVARFGKLTISQIISKWDRGS